MTCKKRNNIKIKLKITCILQSYLWHCSLAGNYHLSEYTTLYLKSPQFESLLLWRSQITKSFMYITMQIQS